MFNMGLNHYSYKRLEENLKLESFDVLFSLVKSVFIFPTQT